MVNLGGEETSLGESAFAVDAKVDDGGDKGGGGIEAGGSSSKEEAAGQVDSVAQNLRLLILIAKAEVWPPPQRGWSAAREGGEVFL